ncbi:DMT family transporter [Streptococcus loxodontisalivarius]|uniref:Drug/metabolite transporter (DMT)-like permease n=1 Tax=Streptococcus loxodontisalivarius TaxID=1349415 RepID=A0ABS2PQY3_9STRE|nr:DMT family transporter [Streptococcus loxodontisalivarius]MBM7642130.1 drug/metabolite transporter (DMT)-like permease [Streptococcus loxodontisalivarius]
MNKQLQGSLMVLIAGTAWGISGVSGQYLMAHGMNVNLLTSLRLLISGLVLTLMAYLGQRERFKQMLKSPKTMVGIVLFSLLGLLMNQYAYLNAIKETNAGTATVLQYVTPILILAYVCLKSRQRPSLIELVAIVMAILGTYIMATHGQFNQLAITPLGLFWGLASAVTYSLYILIPAKLIAEWGSLIIIGPAMLVGGVAFPIFTQSWQYPLDLAPRNLLALFGIIVIGTLFAYTVFLKGTTIVGPVKGSLFASVEPIASVFFAVLIMKESFYAIDFLGMLLIILAVVLISLKDLMALNRNI